MNKQTSLFIKAVAIVMMLSTHLFSLYPSSSLISIPLGNGKTVSSYIGYACVLCVAIFAFLNGFGLQKSYEGKTLGQTYLYAVKKAAIFLAEYWIILFSLFFPFYACSVAGAIDWILVLRSLIGWGGGLLPFAWYVYFYIGVLFTLPLVRYLFPKGRVLGVLLAYLPLILAALVWGFLDKADRFTQYRELLVYYACVLGGFAFAKYSWFETVRGWFKRAKIDRWWFYLPLAMLSLIGVSLIRNVLLFPFASLLILFACVYLFERSVPKWIAFPLRWLGTLSMPIWFIHYVFFADYINRFISLYTWVNFPRLGPIILVFCLLISAGIALIYHALFSLPGHLLSKRKCP